MAPACKETDMLAQSPTYQKTVVYIADGQLEQLQNVADHSKAPGGALLRQELDRAIVLAVGDSPQVFVRLNSIVEYTDLLTGRSRKLSLVLPHEADIDQNRISVTTPVGAALLGLTPGQPFSWTTDEGRPRALVVRSVTEPS
jgi:regulator of nucleoside diphosphate kinase